MKEYDVLRKSDYFKGIGTMLPGYETYYYYDYTTQRQEHYGTISVSPNNIQWRFTVIDLPTGKKEQIELSDVPPWFFDLVTETTNIYNRFYRLKGLFTP
jgi:hypothetical protein